MRDGFPSSVAVGSFTQAQNERKLNVGKGPFHLHQYRIRPSREGFVRLYLYKFGSLVRSLAFLSKEPARMIGAAWKAKEEA